MSSRSQAVIAIVLGVLLLAVALYFLPQTVSNAARALRTSSAMTRSAAGDAENQGLHVRAEVRLNAGTGDKA